MEEVRFHYLRPEQATARRDACSVAYIPLGTLEWHGLHNPMGADGLQAETLAERCACKGGGVVFPTLYYGESRAGSLLETDPQYVDGIAEYLGITPNSLSQVRQPLSPYTQIEQYQRLLVHILAEVASYGFKLTVFVVGHYPLLDHARAAMLSYNQWIYDMPWDHMAVWAFADFKLLHDAYENPGDHAGGWETSHLLASHPKTVDLARATPQLQHGIMTGRDPQNATAAFGNEIYDRAVDLAIKHVAQRLSNRKQFSGHGMPIE